MKALEREAIDSLLGIIPNHPRVRIAHFSESGEVFVDALNALAKDREYEYQLSIVNADFLSATRERCSFNDISLIKGMKWEQNRYASEARQFDFLFVTAEVPQDFRREFAQKIYSHIKSAGQIILFLEKHNSQNCDEWQMFLEEYAFVSMSTLDIFKNYELLIARKMHGWSGK